MKLTSALVTAFQNSVRRFPLPSAFVTLLTLILIIEVNDNDAIADRTFFTLCYYFSVGFLLTLTLRLWEEENVKRSTVRVVNVIAHVLLLADAIYLYNVFTGIGSVELLVAHGSAIFTLFISLFFLSFWHEKDNIVSWNFTLQLILNAGICTLIGHVMMAGMSLLLASLHLLFGFDVRSEWYVILECLFGLLLSALLFLGRIPQGAKKHDYEPLDSSFLNAVMRFLFLPLVGLYILVLYIYAGKILLTWELPDGWVSWLVCASMVGCIVIEFGLYPVRKLQDKRADHLIARWLPVVILPLLVLMSVGIVRRLSDYGITVNRLYLLTLNLWFYFVCITLFLTKARRINWITISFTLIFLLTSALPINYISLTRHHMTSSIERILEGQRLPLNAAQFDKLMKALPEEDGQRLCIRLDYMRQTFGYQSTDAYIDNDDYVPLSKYINPTDEVETDIVYSSIQTSDIINIPAGYTRFLQNTYCPVIGCLHDQDTVEVEVMISGTRKATVLVSMDSLMAHTEHMPAPILMPCTSDSCIFAVTSFNIDYTDKAEQRLDVCGILFIK
ncbi:MAG: DUF4153 domain-containing protein [Bacteroidaceae bacterium]|nr:DUF4153 domain-containing protein [Bacteroidaceae bacterium]